jgi:spore germination cell wall hydrolase CwlJ-like protein
MKRAILRTVLGLAAAALFIQPAMASQDPVENEALHCLALTVYWEAGSEQPQGRRAVAHVVMNRVDNEQFPDSVCDVVQQSGGGGRFNCQFHWYCDGRSDDPTNETLWHKAVESARAVMSGQYQDPTNGALFFHASSVNPRWDRHYQRTARIGHHVFYK